MQQVMENFETLRNPWKWAIRKRVWDYMEAKNIARNPRPVHHRIPNFEGAELAAANLCSLPEFQSAKVVKVNPDTPQKEVRFGVLTAGKRLMAPQVLSIMMYLFAASRPARFPASRSPLQLLGPHSCWDCCTAATANRLLQHLD